MVKLSWILTQESGMDVELLIISQIRLVKWEISGLPCPRCHWLDRYLFLGNLKAFLKALKMQPSIDSLAESSIWSRASASARPVQVILFLCSGRGSVSRRLVSLGRQDRRAS
jgi:hypothetical protein